MLDFVMDLATNISFLDAVFTIIGIVGTLIFKKLREKIKTFKLKIVLSFVGNNCLLTVPTFMKYFFTRNYSTILLHDASLQHKVYNLLYKLNTDINLFVESQDFIGNEIHIGGPAANINTNRYISEHFPDFKWCITSEHFERYSKEDLQNLSFTDFIEINDSWEGFIIGNNKYEYIPGKQDWAILIKLSKKNFVDINPKTVHMLFGCGSSGTKGAVNYFVNNYQKIYKKCRSNDYVLPIKVDKKGSVNSVMGITNIIDFQ